MSKWRTLQGLLAADRAAPTSSARLVGAGRGEAKAALEMMGSSQQGLSQDEAEHRLARLGRNEITSARPLRPWRRLWRTVCNPLVMLLGGLAIISFVTRDAQGGSVMSIILAVGIALRFTQEARADASAAKLRAMVHTVVTVWRGGEQKEIPLEEVVPGDVVDLAAGDVIPADVRLLVSKDLFVTQSILTGESLPIEKHAEIESKAGIPAVEFTNLCFMGTGVESGSARALVIETGKLTYLGSMADHLVKEAPETSFDRGVRQFTWLMIRFITIMVPLVCVINGLTRHQWREAFLFSVAIAVGLTPEMLPMIVSVCLAKGALAMSRRKVVVKQLNAIQNFGAMDVLCTDKTGTLTRDRVILERYCDVHGNVDDTVLLDGYLLSHFQTGLRNVLDRAILEHKHVHDLLSVDDYQKLDEIPFDFSRRMMSVCVKTPKGEHLMFTKGAPEAVFRCCKKFEQQGLIHDMEPGLIDDLTDEYRWLSGQGFRVLAVAYRPAGEQTVFSKADERDLILRGYLAFLDPPKESAAGAVADLQKQGIRIKVLTGDNELVTRKVCHEVGITAERVILGADVVGMEEQALAKIAEDVDVFARLTPQDKERVVRALRSRGHVVGFLGDGINDAPAMRCADVAISVDTAADIAKECAPVILLEKSLDVLSDGVTEGRKVFVNILKYVRMGASSNFGNMISMLGASAFLPFLPMSPLQVLANNLLYDFSQIPIPTDEVEPEQIATPCPWQIGELTRFILLMGPLSCIFDYLLFFVMLKGFDCWNPDKAPLFQTAWFVESLITQTLIIHVIRTNKIPFFQSRASWPLTLTTLLIILLAVWLPFSPLAGPLGFTCLPANLWPILMAILTGYLVLAQAAKRWMVRKRWL